mmetsp:Transcript_23109/g.54625  ORF Transcript_23109/g.54625 Transcript_23109/m.54625 type:complete len:1089 (+) Transcript_23109:289-3555(+)
MSSSPNTNGPPEGGLGSAGAAGIKAEQTGEGNNANAAELKGKVVSQIKTASKSSPRKKDDKSPSPKQPAAQTAANAAAASAEDADGGIITPHDHDVLSGRGNSVNHHPGNEYFRSLVRHHKLAYVRCPKPQKEQFSKLIVSTVRDREPPGRFLKQNSQTKTWYNIGTQKALDKTRQALREGAPATVAGLMLSQGLTPSAAAAAGLTPSQAVSTLGVSGDSELMQNSNGGAGGPSGSSNPFLSHHPQQHAHSHHSAAHHAAAAAAAAAAANQQQQQHQHNAAMAAAAHSRMVNSSYYNAAAAAAAAAGAGVNYPNSPKPPMTASSSGLNPGKLGQDGAASDVSSSGANLKDRKISSAQPSPQSPPPGNPRLPPSAAPPNSSSYPPIPPPSSSDEAMKYHAAQVVRMAAAAHAASGNGSSGGTSGNSGGSGFGNSTALAAAAGTFNPVLLEHIMAQHRGSGGSTGMPPNGGSGMDWSSSRQPPPSSGGRSTGEYPNHQYPGYPPPPNNGQAQQQQHEDIHAKGQRQEAYIAHLQERIQQQERQLLTLCSHILLSPPPPPGGGVVNSPAPPTASSSNPIAGSNGPGSNGSAPGGAGGSHHNALSHPQYAAAAKMNAAAAVANINATTAAVKELQSYAGTAESSPTNPSTLVNERANAHTQHAHDARARHAAAVAQAAAAAQTASSGANGAAHVTTGTPLPSLYGSIAAPAATQAHVPSSNGSTTTTTTVPASSAKAQSKTAPTNYGNGHANNTSATKEKATTDAVASNPAAADKTPAASPAPEKSERPTDDGDAVAALLALGIGKSPSPAGAAPATEASTAAPVAAAAEEASSSNKKKRKATSGGRRILPLKKKQIQQQQESNKANNSNNSYHQPAHAQQQRQQQHLQHSQPPRQQQQAIPMNQMILQNSRAVIPKPPLEMSKAPELYLYGETPIHEPHVHDVLCGRGALTNEHPGNEWFRRLVRSNRQLYRSCPKHTKLLVAKAIVQAVQRTQRNPPGRFLEKTKTADGTVSNTWTPITYKSAVEKASQALREKVTPNWGAPPSNFPLSKALEAARAVAYLEKEYPSGDGFGGTNLLALIMAVVQSAGLD